MVKAHDGMEGCRALGLTQLGLQVVSFGFRHGFPSCAVGPLRFNVVDLRQTRQ